MPSIQPEKRKFGERNRSKVQRPSKKARRRFNYNSDSSDSANEGDRIQPKHRTLAKKVSQAQPQDGPDEDDDGIEVEGGVLLNTNDIQDAPSGDEDDSQASESDSESDMSSQQSDDAATTSRPKPAKRNDPSAFSSSIQKILSTKLPTSVRADPVLSRSREAANAAASLASESLDKKAQAEITAQRKNIQDNGRVKDVLSYDGKRSMGEVQDEEKRLRKVAQRGVIKLFNAVRAAQVKAEEAERVSRANGLVGRGRKEEKRNELSKQGFMDLISGSKEPGVKDQKFLKGDIEEA